MNQSPLPNFRTTAQQGMLFNLYIFILDLALLSTYWVLPICLPINRQMHMLIIIIQQQFTDSTSNIVDIHRCHISIHAKIGACHSRETHKRRLFLLTVFLPAFSFSLLQQPQSSLRCSSGQAVGFWLAPFSWNSINFHPAPPYSMRFFFVSKNSLTLQECFEALSSLRSRSLKKNKKKKEGKSENS